MSRGKKHFCHIHVRVHININCKDREWISQHRIKNLNLFQVFCLCTNFANYDQYSTSHRGLKFPLSCCSCPMLLIHCQAPDDAAWEMSPHPFSMLHSQGCWPSSAPQQWTAALAGWSLEKLAPDCSLGLYCLFSYLSLAGTWCVCLPVREAMLPQGASQILPWIPCLLSWLQWGLGFLAWPLPLCYILAFPLFRVFQPSTFILSFSSQSFPSLS